MKTISTFYIERAQIKRIHTIFLILFLNLIFLQTTTAEDQFHHVQNCGVYHDMDYLTNFIPSTNLRGIRSVIQTPNSGSKEVVLLDRSHTDGNASDFADGDAIYNGICEVCHTVNNHHNNDGHDNTAHFDGKRCTACHLHSNEFAPPVKPIEHI